MAAVAEELSGFTVVVPARRAVSVEYPGYIQNVDKALATLGGAAEVSSAVLKDAAHLRLRFRWAQRRMRLAAPPMRMHCM